MREQLGHIGVVVDNKDSRARHEPEHGLCAIAQCQALVKPRYESRMACVKAPPGVTAVS
jgi:hypothetical protein